MNRPGLKAANKKPFPTRQVLVSPRSSFAKAMSFSDQKLQIAMHNEPRLVIECTRSSTVVPWVWTAERTYAQRYGAKDSIEKCSYLPDRRRSVTFANRITFGNKFRLLGDFAVHFNTPSAPDF